MKAHQLTIIASAAIALAGCSGKEQWKVAGSIYGAEGKTIVLESVNNGNWTAIDSATISDEGAFAINSDRQAHPDIYRLTVDGRSLYFPIDSVETINVETSLADFDTNYKLSGSRSADMMQAANDRIMASLKANGENTLPTDSVLKRDLANLITADWTNIVSYYLINKTIGTTPLFDSSINFDRKIINGVANQYAQQLPDDPRTEMLKNRSLQNQRIYNSSTGHKLYAEEIPFVDIALRDRDGNSRSLAEEWKKGKVIVLNFNSLTSEGAPAYNVRLSKIYDKFKDRGLEIYQVAVGDDEFAWSQAAKNLPWISVYQPSTDASALVSYNVAVIPTTFVIDRTGDTMTRVENVDQIESEVAKVI